MNVLIDPTMPEDEIRLETPTQIVRMTNMGRPRVLEPTSIDKLKPGERFAVDPEMMYIPLQWREPDRNPNPLMRALGFTSNPETCIHYRKRFRTRWICSDCGVSL